MFGYFDETLGVFHLQKNRKFSIGDFRLGRVSSICHVPFERAEGGLAAEKTAEGMELVTDKDEKSVNGT